MPKKGSIKIPTTEKQKKQFIIWCNHQCTEEEICEYLFVTPKTLQRWCKRMFDGMTFSQVYSMYSSGGKMSLRRYQFELAKKNASMAKFLGKNILHQKDEFNYKGDIQNADEDDPITKSLKSLMTTQDKADG